MATNTPRSQESTETVTGPHVGRDSDGDLDHRYWRCERCGLETTDRRLREGCFRCGGRVRDEEPGGEEKRDGASGSEVADAQLGDRRPADGARTDG
ncbi:hypothetical protein M0R88_07535 [Halorussus gelatinilyticus]|uniref:DUF8118 domain-containing protein n=1 Tax=Halorussus gelatinilyticus TaxID=2937524 RepID=A0A8U0IPJ9_9EURY|nr:hypothetical protein [Halorussus gelatinilyticus]UPW01939.1 hypothetical protein M0R88_07535 [Halorussus gelatinilyticus]